MTKTPNRSSLSRRVLQAASSFKAMLFRSLFRSSIYESIRPVLSGRMGWLQTLSSLIGRGSENIHKGGVLRVSAKERAKRSAAREFRRRFVMAEQLELRALMAADLGLDPTLSQQPVAAEVGTMVPGQVSQPVGSSNEVVFVDPGVTDPQSLMQGLRAGVEFVMLDGSKDGVAQIAEYLQGKSGIQAIHLVGHGRAGEIYLGSSDLGNGTLDDYVAELSRIGNALTADGDILVYGCETAQGTQGQQFLQQLARLTSADVAGSSDITGAANLGGDWDLEERVGDVSTDNFSPNFSLVSYEGVLGNITINGTFPTQYQTTAQTSIPGGAIGLGAWNTGSASQNASFTIELRNGSSTGTLVNVPLSAPTNNSITPNTATNGRITFTSTRNANQSQTDLTNYFGTTTNSVSFTVPSGFSSSLWIVMSLQDINGTPTTASRSLTSSGIPTVTAPTTVSVTEDVASSITFASNAFSDADSPSVTVTLSVGTGSFSSTANANIAIGGSATTPTYTGSIANLNSYFSTANNIRYTTELNGVTSRTFTTTISDQASSAVATTTITVTAVNDAPVASGSASLAAINEDTAAPAGATVSSLFNGNFSDAADGGSSTLAGVAITSYTRDTTKGDWQYFNGTSWTTITTATAISDTSALTLRSTDALRFVPALNFNGDAPALTVRLIETPTSITAGARVNVSSNGGSTTISSDTVVLSHSVTSVNDAPVASGSALLAAINEDTADPVGATVSSLFDGNFSDLADGNSSTLAGVAITSYTRDTTKGDWQYFNGTSWTTITTATAISDTSALTLRSTDSLRFLPASNFNGAAPTLTVRLLETPRSITTGVRIDASTNGGTTTISSGTVVLSHTVNAVNDAPTISLSGTLSYTENAAATVINSTNLAVADVDSANLSGATVSVEGFVAGDGDILGFTNTLKISGTYLNGVLTLTGTATPGEYEAALRSVTYRSTSDNPPATRRLLWQVTDAPTPGASSAVATSTISITAVNDAPVVYLGGGTTLNVLRQFTESSQQGQDTSVFIAPSAVIADADSTQLQSLTITLTNAQNVGNEVLTVTGDTTGFSVTGNGTATVTITGNQSLSAYSTLLQSVKYNNTSSNPTTSPVRTITVVARDDAGGSSANSAASTASVALSSVNNAPVYSTGIENKQLTAGLPFSFSFPTNAFTDAENDTLTYTAQVSGGSLPAWLTFNASTRKFYGVPPTLPTGGLTVTVTAKDPSGGSATKDFTITTVATLNGNPIASVGFATAYNLINPGTHSNSGFYQEETNSFTTASSPFQGTNFVFFQDGVTTFSGNNVPGKLMYINGSGDVVTVPSAGIGNVSRPIKTPGNVVKGYYMWNNAGTSGSVSDDTATLLVVDPNYFTGSTIYNSSSDQVDTALNGYLTAVSFDIAPASANEGTASPGSINFVVTRSSISGTATVQYSTSISGIDNASANDFVAASGTYTFPTDSPTGTISIATRNDAVFEPNETFTLTLSNPLVDNGQIAQGRLINSQATGTIVNDDTAVFTIAPSGAEEGTPPGAGNAMTFTITRVGSSAVSQTVSYATALRGTGEGFASADDFGSTSGSLIFAPGETTKTFTVTTVPDDIVENDEVFDVILSSPTNGATVSLTNGSAIGTIEDDESNAIYSIANSGNTEGSTVTFTITRSRLVDIPQTISFFTTIETGDTATSGTDFTAVTSGVQTITFGVSELTRTVTVSTIQDTIYEGNETFTVVLDALQVLENRSTKISSFNGKAKGTILDDETAPVFSVTAIDGPTKESVDGVGQTIRFRVSRNVVSQADQTIDYATFVGTAGEDDYIPVAGTLTFPSTGVNSLSQTVTVTLKNDSIVESTENFTLQISNPTGGATLGASSATGTILDSNKAPVAGGTITTLEDTPYVIQPGNIYTDPEGSGLAAIDITNLPNSEMGFLQRATTRDANGVPLESGWQDITTTGELQISGVSGIGIDGLRFNPAPNKFTTTTPVTFNLRVNDGSVWSTAAGTVTINITPVNDAPAGTDVAPPQSAYVGGFITFTESQFVMSDSNDNPAENNFLGVVFTDVPERPNPTATPPVPNKGALQVQVSENSTSRTGNIPGARDIRTSAFSQSTTEGNPQFVTAESGSWTFSNVTYDKRLMGRYGIAYLESTTGNYRFEQYTNGSGGFEYIARYTGSSVPYTPVYEPLNIPTGTMVSDGFLFDVGENGTDFFRRTLTLTLTGTGSGFNFQSNVWKTVVDGEFVSKATITAEKLRYSPCFCGVARYNRDGGFQLIATSGTFTTIKFQVQDDGGTANGGVDLDPTPNDLPITLIDGFTPVLNVPGEQYFNEDTTLSFNAFGEANALYVTYAPPSGPVNDLVVVVELDSRSRPGTLSLDGNWPSGVTATNDGAKIIKYQIEGNTAFVNSALAALNFTPDLDHFSTTDLGAQADPRYPGLNGIGGTDTYTILKVSARNKPESGQMQYPSAYANVDMSVLNVNDAPVVVDPAATLPEVFEDNASPTISTVSDIFSDSFSDSKDLSPNTSYVTNQTLAGIAVRNYSPDTTKGSWQYSELGTSWTNLPARSNDDSNAFALSASYRLRFLPAANYNGSVPSLTVRLIESSSTPVTVGSLDVSTNGDTTRFSTGTVVLSASVTAVNDAPIATGASTLPAILEDNLNPTGDSVSSLFTARFNDSADQVTGGTSASTLAGIAITNYTRASSKGEWQYSSNNGTSWTTISSSISGNASAMTLLSTDMLRFLPRTDFNGPAPTLTVRLLETPRSITSGATVDVSTNGGSTTISSGTVVLSHSVTARNDAPVASGSATLSAINEDTTNPPGATVSSLFTSNYSDSKDQVIGGSNANNFLGIAVQVHTIDATRGTWEYTSGTTWTPLPSVSGNNAILLRATDQIRFVPAANYNGPATPLVVRLLDMSNNTTNAQTAGSIVDTTTNGGTTEISEGLVTLTHTVNPVNDPPTSTNNTITINEDEVRPLTNADFGNYSDVENQPFSAIKIVTAPSKGTLQYNIDGVWTTITTGDFSISDASIKFRYIPALNENGSNYTTIEYRVSDGVDFSVSTYTLTIDVTPVNDPPISTDDSVTFNEDTLYYFNVSDFGTYSDIENNQATVPNMIMITSLPSLGTLEYNNGTSWVPALNAVITPNLLTGSSATSKLRYTPPANAFGSPFTGFGFKVSDGTDYSLSSYTVTINIAPVNDAPVASGSASLASVFKNDTSPPWATVSSLFSGNFSDPLDTGNTTDSFYGVAIRGLTQDASKGTWQYKIGSNIGAVPNSSDATAFVLRVADSLRFVPFADVNTPYVGIATPLSVRLIETKSSDEASATGASDTSGSTANVSTNGGTTVYSAATVALNHEVKGTLLVKAFNDVSEGSDAIFRVSLDSNSNVGGTSVTLGLTNGLTPGSALPTSDYGPGYREAYYYDNSSNKQTLPISNNVLTLPQNVTVFYVSVPTTNDTPKVYEGPETFSLSASITAEGTPISNSDAATIRDDGNGKVFNEDGTVNNSATPDNDLSVFVTGYGPVNEGSTYAMFKVDAASGDGLNFSVINGTATLVTPTIEFSLDGTTWTVFNASDNNGFPTVLDGAGNIGTVYVRVTITSESDSMYEGSERFLLRATSRANSSVTATAHTDIVDDGTGLKYTGDFTGTPKVPATDGTNLDNDLSVDVTSYSPVNEGSTWAMFKVVGGAGDRIDLAVSDGTITGTPGTTGLSGAVVEFSYNGTDWFTYGSSSKPLVPGSVGTGSFYVRVNITAEQETALDTGEVFTLTATSNGLGAKSRSVETTIFDNGSGTVFNGLFGNDLPQISNVYRDDDRLLAVANTVFNGSPAPVTFSDIRVNDTNRAGLTISELIGLNPTASMVSSTFSSQGTWTVLTGGQVRYVPAAGQKTDPDPIDYAISPDGGVNYSLNTAKLYVDYAPITASDSLDNQSSSTEVLTVNVLANDTNGDIYDPNTLKIVRASDGALLDTLTVAGQGVWDVFNNQIRFRPTMSGGTKAFTGDPTPIQYVVRDRVTEGGLRGGNLSNRSNVSITYRDNVITPTFWVRVNDSNTAAEWDIVIVDNVFAAGVPVTIQSSDGYSLVLTTTAADQSNTVGVILYDWLYETNSATLTPSFSSLRVEARSKPVLTNTVADIRITSSAQSRGAAVLEIQASDQGFISANSFSNVLGTPLSGTQNGSRVTLRETIGLNNQANPNRLASTTTSVVVAGQYAQNFVQSTIRTVNSNRTSAQFATTGQPVSLMKSLVQTHTGASQVGSFNSGGYVVNDSFTAEQIAAAAQWVLEPVFSGFEGNLAAENYSVESNEQGKRIRTDAGRNYPDFEATSVAKSFRLSGVSALAGMFNPVDFETQEILVGMDPETGSMDLSPRKNTKSSRSKQQNFGSKI